MQAGLSGLMSQGCPGKQLPRELCHTPVQVSPVAETQAGVCENYQAPGFGLLMTMHSQLTVQQSSRLRQQAVSCHPWAAQNSYFWPSGQLCPEERY